MYTINMPDQYPRVWWSGVDAMFETILFVDRQEVDRQLSLLAVHIIMLCSKYIEQVASYIEIFTGINYNIINVSSKYI